MYEIRPIPHHNGVVVTVAVIPTPPSAIVAKKNNGTEIVKLNRELIMRWHQPFQRI